VDCEGYFILLSLIILDFLIYHKGDLNVIYFVLLFLKVSMSDIRARQVLLFRKGVLENYVFYLLTNVLMPGPGHSAVWVSGVTRASRRKFLSRWQGFWQVDSRNLSHTWRRAAFHASPGRKR